ncbi:hypothetical protein F4678DRAFT_482515 [Xylaria arbuscula]|nr:hypothetical protein F4678DRAFT_482515 [Xylaria arbuscula]
MSSNPQLQRNNSGLQDMPIEMILEIASNLNSPQDLINFSLAYPPYMDHWIHLTEIIQHRTRYQEDPAGIRLFQSYSLVTMQRLFSPEIQRLLLLILFMPNPSNEIYDTDFRRAHPQVGDPSPYPLIFQRRAERFQMYYHNAESRDLLFTYRNFIRIAPLCDTIRAFATDFAKKSLSNNANIAHHAPPSFAHESLNMPREPDFPPTIYYRDQSTIQDLSRLHETERERLMLAFYQYEAMCATSAKVTGYWEIRRAVDGQAERLNGWNQRRIQQSPLAGQSLCQIERVRCVYTYVRLQYLIIFNQLWVEYRERLETIANYARENNITDGENRPWGALPPAIFADGDSMVEWLDILCSKGLMFLHEVLSMDKDRRRQFFCQTYYPTRVRPTNFLVDAEYLVNGIFHMLNREEALTDLNYSDALEDAGAQNHAWVQFNNMGDGTARHTLFSSEVLNNLRREGWVFWNADRCRQRGLAHRNEMEVKAAYQPLGFFHLPYFFDHRVRIGRVRGELLYGVLLDKVWLKAREPFMTPASRPSVVEFGVQGERWRLGEDVNEHGEPILPSYDFTRTLF